MSFEKWLEEFYKAYANLLGADDNGEPHTAAKVRSFGMDETELRTYWFDNGAMPGEAAWQEYDAACSLG